MNWSGVSIHATPNSSLESATPVFHIDSSPVILGVVDEDTLFLGMNGLRAQVDRASNTRYSHPVHSFVDPQELKQPSAKLCDFTLMLHPIYRHLLHHDRACL
jgi:hypothetical protein